MSLDSPAGSAAELQIIRSGTVIPAHPLVLTADRTLDERRQRAVSRYYLDAGVGGLAVGVHTTQFAIREAGLYPDVLRLAAEEARNWVDRPVALIAGVVGDTDQAVAETEIALEAGYHAVLLNLAAWKGRDESAILAHCRAVAERAPVIGFALLPEVGGMHPAKSFSAS